MNSHNERVGEIKVDGFTFIWEIEDFEDQCDEVGESIRSPYFQIRYPVSLSSHHWYFLLYPHGKNETYEDCVSIYLCDESSEDIQVSYKISILNHISNEETNVVTSVASIKKNHGIGTNNLITREELSNNSDSLLVDDTLMIKCTIQLDPYSKNEMNSTLSSNLEEMYTSGKYSDISIQVGRRKIKAHKSILAARSSTFANMIKRVQPENGRDTIKITNFSYEVMNEVLLFIYCEKVTKIQELGVPLLQAAYQYGLDRLKIMCEKSLWNALSIRNAVETLKTANSCYCTELKSKTMKFIVDNMKEVVKTPGFAVLKYEYARLLEEIIVAIQNN